MAQEKRAELDADFTAFVEANAQRIRSLAEWLSGDPERAADLAQSALERTYVRWGHIQSQDPMAYVRRALLNQQRDWWRRRQRRPEWPAATVPDVPDLEDHAAGHALRDVMRTALAQLTRRERAVVVLRYYADLTDADIAEELGIAVGTVKSTSARALRKLRALLGPSDAAGLTLSAADQRATSARVASARVASAQAASARATNIPAASEQPPSHQATDTPGTHFAAAHHPSAHQLSAHHPDAHLRPGTSRRRGEA